MQRKTTEDLREIARCGGSIILYADTRPIDDLILIASELSHGATLTLNGMARCPTEDICRIVAAAPGRVAFAG